MVYGKVFSLLYFLWAGLLSLFFKWERLIFILISMELLLLCLMIYFSSGFSELIFFYFICIGVISSMLGLLVLVWSMKEYGSEHALF